MKKKLVIIVEHLQFFTVKTYYMNAKYPKF